MAAEREKSGDAVRYEVFVDIWSKYCLLHGYTEKERRERKRELKKREKRRLIFFFSLSLIAHGIIQEVVV